MGFFDFLNKNTSAKTPDQNAKRQTQPLAMSGKQKGKEREGQNVCVCTLGDDGCCIEEKVKRNF